MRITFDQIIERKEWLHREILSSMTPELIEKAANDRFYDVTLFLNGIEVDTNLFNDILNNIEKYIDTRARILITEKYQEAEDKARKLHEMVDAVTKSINDNFSTELEYYI